MSGLASRRDLADHPVEEKRRSLTDREKSDSQPALLDQETHHGYLFWGLTIAAILITELLGANFISGLTRVIHEHVWAAIPHVNLTIPWPTISWTVGRLENDWTPVAALVVGSITVTVFYALSKQPRHTSQGRSLRDPNATWRPLHIYGWWMSIFPPLAAGLIGYYALHVGTNGLDADESAHRKLLLGCVIYGTFAVFGVIVPSVLILFAKREVQFPTLMFTIRRLRHRWPWTAAVIVAGLSILYIHLALYPWPDISREPISYAGNTADQARAKAVAKVKEVRSTQLPKLFPSAQLRGVSADAETAWIVFFKPVTANGRCFVLVRDKLATPVRECKG
jgi:hypothetical protein